MMKRSSWIGVLAVLVVGLLGAGCGGRQPLEAFKDRKFRIDYSAGSITATPTPPGHYLLFVSLQESGFPSCTALSPDVVATVNGDSNVSLAPGGCTPKGSSSPGLTYELEVGAGAQDATIVLSDETHRMEVQVENLLAAYRLQPQKDGFDPSLEFQEGANPVSRGEVLSFDRTPDLRAASSFDAIMTKERNVGTASNPRFEWTDFDVQPTLNGAQVQVTVPTDIEDGMASLNIHLAEDPTVLRCEGARSCEAEVNYGIETTVTVQP